MNSWIRGIIIFLIMSTLCLSQISSSRRTRAKQKQRPKRSVSSDIQNCKHWKFETTEDPHFADVHVKLKNVASATKKMSVALQCVTMNKILEPKSASDVLPGKTHDLTFRITVASKFYHRDSSVRQHKCQLSTWNDDAHSLVTCKFNISVWPNGVFYYKCSKYHKGQLTVSQSSTTNSKKINLFNSGDRSILLINSTCKPVVLTLQLVDMYKNLDKDQEWSLEFPLSCSGATSLNYHGNCSVRIYHVCREVTTRVRTIKFEFMDGEIPECEYVKSIFGRFARNNGFAASLVVNDDWSAVLSIIAVAELVLIIGTLLVKFIFVGLTKDWKSSREEFCDRFHKAVRLTRGSPSNEATDNEPNQNTAEDHGIVLDENRE